MNIRKDQRGFTLVEIAIVMVIIGLLLGGALKGQEMITNAKNKRIKADFDQLVAAMYSYQDIYRALPGDNAKSNTQHSTSSVPTGKKAGNGLLDTSTEAGFFWRDLRSAGLIAGSDNDTDGIVPPRNAFSGPVTVRSGILDQSGVVMCFEAVPAASASIIDNQYDDGKPDSGTIRGTNKKATDIAGGSADKITDYANIKSLCLGVDYFEK